MRRLICGVVSSFLLAITVGCTGAANTADVPKNPDPKPTAGPSSVTPGSGGATGGAGAPNLPPPPPPVSP